MSLFNQPTVSKQDFKRALKIRANIDPNVINIDENWWPKMTEKEANIMIDSCIKEMKENICPVLHSSIY